MRNLLLHHAGKSGTALSPFHTTKPCLLLIPKPCNAALFVGATVYKIDTTKILWTQAFAKAKDDAKEWSAGEGMEIVVEVKHRMEVVNALESGS